MKTSMARFPFHKTLESFDFKFQPSIDPKVIRELATCRWPALLTLVLLGCGARPSSEAVSDELLAESIRCLGAPQETVICMCIYL